MQDKLLICSKSTRRFFENYENVLVVSGSPRKKDLQLLDSHDRVIACGGGGVIDFSKIVSKNELLCYPTTAAGSCQTSHSVVWDGKKKLSIKRRIPSKVIVEEKYLVGLPDKILRQTKIDAISHCLDCLWSLNATPESLKYVKQSLEILETEHTNKELIIAGNLAGKAIELTPTTILHALSYPLTGFYGYSHGEALEIVLPKICSLMRFDITKYINIVFNDPENIDYTVIVEEAFKYGKIKYFKKEINSADLIKHLSKEIKNEQ